MKHLLLFLSLFFIFGSYLTKTVYSQEPTPQDEVFDFQKAYKDYIYIYENYKKAHADYLLARSQYLQAQTLASQTKAQNATVVLLQARDDVVVAYLTTLRLKLAEAQGVGEAERNGLYSRLDSEVSWYKNHKSQIPSAGTLDDLVKDSQEAADHFKVIEPLAYEVLATVPIGKIEIFKTNVTQIISEIKSKTDEIRAKGDHDTSITERWIIETENKITRSIDKQIEAQRLVVTLQTPPSDNSSQRVNYSKTYDQVISLLNESNQFLREASGYMKEIIKSIKVDQD